jgi:NAD(P)-dependent dehydrogenase (short-subunit alcohol dehydrogenase family)
MLQHTPDEMIPAIAAKTTIGRLGEAHEIASGILYLVSDAATYVTGTTLKVDGGYSKWA